MGARMVGDWICLFKKIIVIYSTFPIFLGPRSEAKGQWRKGILHLFLSYHINYEKAMISGASVQNSENMTGNMLFMHSNKENIQNNTCILVDTMIWLKWWRCILVKARRFEEGPKNPLKGISMKSLVPACYAQFRVGAGG